MIWLSRPLVTETIGQTLFFKFSGAPESVYIFTQLGVEPWGRLGLGILELLAIVLLWFPHTLLIGITLILGMMIGSLASHVLILGIDVLNDGEKLFFLALVTLAGDLGLAYAYRKEFNRIYSTFRVKR